MNGPLKLIAFAAAGQASALPPGRTARPRAPRPLLQERDPGDPDVVRRRALLEKVRDDRDDLVRVATAVRGIAESVEAARNTLAFTRRSLRWLLLAGSTAALTLWLSNGRRPRSALIAGLSMQLLQHWLKPASRRPMPPAATPRLAAPAEGRMQAA